MRGGEIFSVQFRDPVTELVVSRRYKAALLTFEGMAGIDGVVAAVAEVKGVCGIYYMSQEEGISPFLSTHFRPIYCGRMHPQPCP